MTQPLTILERSELIRLIYGGSAESEYEFHHILIQQATYNSLLKADQKMLHVVVAQILEKLFESRLDEIASTLGWHYAQAGDSDRAFAFFVRAGDFAKSRYANQEAINAYSEAIYLSKRGSAQIPLYIQRGSVYVLTGQWSEAEADYHEALKLSDEESDLASAARCEWEIGLVARERGDYELALSWLKRSEEDFEKLGDRVALGKTLNDTGGVYYRKGNYVLASQYIENGLNLARETGVKDSIVSSLIYSGAVAYTQGRLEEARHFYGEALTLGREIGSRRGIPITLNNLGLVAQELGDLSAAQTYYEESLALEREMDHKNGIAVSLVNLGLVAQELGDHVLAQTRYEEGLILSRELGDKWSIANALENLGNLAVERDPTKAREAYMESILLAQETNNQPYVAYGLNGLAAVAVKDGNLNLGLTLLSAADTLRQSIGLAWEANERHIYENTLALARAKLNEADFHAAWDFGKQLTTQAAIKTALEV